MRIVTKRSGPNLRTFIKIQNLAALREDYLREHGQPPLFIPACRRIGIGHRVVKRHTPELVAKWKDPGFHW